MNCEQMRAKGLEKQYFAYFLIAIKPKMIYNKIAILHISIRKNSIRNIK